MNNDYPHKLTLTMEHKYPPNSCQVRIDTDNGAHTTYTRYFFTKEEFLSFWKPLVEQYKVYEQQN